MVKPYVSENEMKQFQERTQATAELSKKYGVQLVFGSNVEYNLFEVIIALYSERLHKSSKALNTLTIVLIILTIILAILTSITVWKCV